MDQVTHCIYHFPCWDGFASAYAIWKKWPNATFIPAKHGDAPPQLSPDAKLVICDFSYPRETVLAMKAVHEVVVIDHHKTAEKDLEGLDFALFDMAHSGAYLTWIWAHSGEPIPEMIKYVQDRDLWANKLPLSLEYIAALQSYPYEFEEFDRIVRGEPQSVEQLCKEGIGILRAKMQMVKIMADTAVVRNVGGHMVPVANTTVYYSEVGDELCKRFPEAPFAAYYMDRKDGKRQWGMRARGAFDCSVVAKKLGGGGHPAASGFVTALDILEPKEIS